MPRNTTIPWRRLETWSPVAFILAGALFLLNTVLEGLGRYTALVGEPTFLNAAIYLSALVGSLVGLLGFYRLLADRAPRLARLSAVVVAVAGLGLSVLLVWASITAVLNRPMPPVVLLVVALVTIVLGFILFTVTSLWTGVPSRTVSLLLGVFVVTWFGGLILGFLVFAGNAPDWLAVVLNGISSIVFLGIALDLWAGSASSKRTNLAADSTAK